MTQSNSACLSVTQCDSACLSATQCDSAGLSVTQHDSAPDSVPDSAPDSVPDSAPDSARLSWTQPDSAGISRTLRVSIVPEISIFPASIYLIRGDICSNYNLKFFFILFELFLLIKVLRVGLVFQRFPSFCVDRNELRITFITQNS